MKNFLRALITLVLTTVITINPLTVSALSSYYEDFFAENNILFYDPTSTYNVCFTQEGSSGTNYRGEIVINDAQQTLITKYRPIYQEAASAVDIPWQVLPAIHIRETSLSLVNPSNGQGIYQFAGGDEENNNAPFEHTGAPVTEDEFARQTKLAANFLKHKNPNLSASALSDLEIQRSFFMYNGTASVYKTQALDLGFTQEQADAGWGSPYVMNRYDEIRDPLVEPTKSNNTWGQIKRDYQGIEYPANTGFGAFVLYQAITGNNGCGGTSDIDALMQYFQKFIDDTKANYPNAYPTPHTLITPTELGVEGGGQGTASTAIGTSSISIPCWEAWDCGQCTALSNWFVNKVAGISIGGGNGYQTASKLGAKHNVVVDSQPEYFSVFSSPPTSTNESGHTGIVMEVNEDGSIITIEQNQVGRGALSIHRRTLYENYSFAHLKDYVNGNI